MRKIILILTIGLMLTTVGIIYIHKSPNHANLVQIVDDYTFFADTQELKVTVVAKDLNIPWEIIWGPDNNIWFTQRNGIISRLDLQSGDIRNLYEIKDSYHWTSSGTLGMALHPNFPIEPYLYVIYTYLEDNDIIMERCVRFTYSIENDTLLNPTAILDNINTGLANYGSRILPIENKLFITLGHGAILPNTPLIIDTIDPGGYVLRLNLDGTIPLDNPWKNNPVIAMGFRNPQGLTVASNGLIYVSEHGPSACDEINLIQAGRSYGWPYTMGACDKYPEEQVKQELEFCQQYNIIEPLFEWTPTIAPCGLQYYGENLIPAWNNCLLLTTLKESDLRVLKLSDDGLQITQETIYLNNKFGRLRDICVSPNGHVYVSTSNTDHDTDDGNEGNGNYILKIEPMGSSIIH